MTEQTPLAGKSIWRLWPMVRVYKYRIGFGIGLNGFARLFDLLPMVLIGWVIDNVSNQTIAATLTSADFLTYGVAIFATFIGLALFQTGSDYAWDTLAQKVRHDLRMKLYGHLQSQDMAFFETRQVGDTMSVLVSDVDNLENFLADATTSIIRLVVTFIGVYGFLLYLDWRLALLLFAPMPFAVIAVRFFATRVQPQYRKSRQAIGAMNSILENNLQGMPVIQAYTAEDDQAKRIEVESINYRDSSVKAAKIRARFVPMLYAIAGLSYALLIGVGGYMTLKGWGPSLGDYVTFILFATRLIMPLFILGMLMNQIQRSEASAKRIMDLLDKPPAILDKLDAKPLEGDPEKISFDGVSFTYPGRDLPVLSNVHLELTQGQMIGVVGPTGAGKSTLLKLLLRAYDPDQGAIKIDGASLSDIQMASFREHLGYVSQDPFLFSGSVRDNIMLGTPDATEAEVLEAARLAGATEFIEGMPEGLDTLVGERGIKLSGGQKQRINLARAILRDPAILLLDEATSAVDTKTERLIQENLATKRDGRITIAVAHRLSTIRRADLIVVLVDGCIVERGTHEQLLASGGVYSDLWNVQSGQIPSSSGATNGAPSGVPAT